MYTNCKLIVNRIVNMKTIGAIVYNLTFVNNCEKRLGVAPSSGDLILLQLAAFGQRQAHEGAHVIREVADVLLAEVELRLRIHLHDGQLNVEGLHEAVRSLLLDKQPYETTISQLRV